MKNEKIREYIALLSSAYKELLIADSIFLPIDSKLPQILSDLHEECRCVNAFMRFLEVERESNSKKKYSEEKINIESFFIQMEK